MQLSPSWETATCATAQEFPNILWKPKVHYRVHLSPPLVPILTQTNPVYIISFYLCKIYLNIILPSMSRSSEWSLSFRLSHQNPICTPLLLHTCYMPCQSHPHWLDHSNSTWRRVEATQLLSMQFSTDK
jgi:hypothetical protein